MSDKSNLVGAILGIVGGVSGLIGLYFSWKSAKSAAISAEEAKKSNHLAEKQILDSQKERMITTASQQHMSTGSPVNYLKREWEHWYSRGLSDDDLMHVIDTVLELKKNPSLVDLKKRYEWFQKITGKAYNNLFKN